MTLTGFVFFASLIFEACTKSSTGDYYPPVGGGGLSVSLPSAVTGLTAARVVATQIDLAWTDASADEDGFVVQRRSPSGAFVAVATLPANTTTFSNTPVAGALAYDYRVFAFNAAGQTSASNVVSVPSPATVPTVPTGLKGQRISATQIDLTWTDASTGEDGFRVERRAGTTGAFTTVTTAAANATSYSDTGLPASVGHQYRVVATNAVAGDSAPSNVVSVMGGGTFTDSGQTLDTDQTYAVALGDLDGDGDLDLVVGNYDQVSYSGLQLFENDGAGAFTNISPAAPLLSGYTVYALSLGDLDGDGALDVAVGAYYSGYSTSYYSRLLINDANPAPASPTFTADAQQLPANGASYSYALSTALGDLDGDGDLDLVIGSDNNDSTWVLENTGVNSGTFADTLQHAGFRSSSNSAYTHGLALGDLDGDGDLDLVEGRRAASIVWINDGTGQFGDGFRDGTPKQSLASNKTRAVVLADLDGDGDLDLVEGNDRFSPSRVLFNDGTGLFNESAVAQPGAPAAIAIAAGDTRAVVVADFDGDGDLDIFFGNTGGTNVARSQNRLYLNDGQATPTFILGWEQAMGTQLATQTLAVGDVDGDLDLDVIEGNDRVGQANRLFLNGP